MNQQIRTFESKESKAQYDKAYEAVLEQWPVPYEEFYVPTRFGDTHVIASGPKDKAPLVLLSSSGSGSVQWYKNAGPLSQHFRIYAVDLIGEVNKSTLTRPILNRQELAEWIGDLFDGLNIEKAYMAGNSFGGFATLNTAIYLPERLEKIILISPAASFVRMGAWLRHLLIPAHMIAPLLHSKRMVLKAYEWLWQDFPMDACYRNLRDITKFAAYPRYRVSRNRVLPCVFSDEELRGIRTPVLLLIGDHEVIYKPEKAIRRAAHLIKDLKAEVVANANHTAQLTAPKIVNDRILDFLHEK